MVCVLLQYVLYDLKENGHPYLSSTVIGVTCTEHCISCKIKIFSLTKTNLIESFCLHFYQTAFCKRNQIYLALLCFTLGAVLIYSASFVLPHIIEGKNGCNLSYRYLTKRINIRITEPKNSIFYHICTINGFRFKNIH